jgi:hypothetical protein
VCDKSWFIQGNEIVESPEKTVYRQPMLRDRLSVYPMLILRRRNTMRKRLICWVCFASVFGLTCDALALVVNNFQEWNQRTQLADLGGLEITSTGHAKFTARVDHDATDVIIHPGGILETLDTYKLPDGRPQPELSNAYVYGTWNARDIQSFGVERAAYIYMGPEGEINITSNTDSGASYNPLAWVDEAQLGGRSLLLAPELDPAVWSIQIEDLGGGAYRITALGPPPGGAAMPTPEDGATDVARDVVLSWTPGPFAPAVNGHRLYLSENFNDVNDGVGGVTLSESSYNPEKRLELGTTYYWRVDEVNGAPDFTVYPGDVWSFETEPVALTIANVTATASSTASNQGPASAVVDGSGLTDGLHSTDTQAMWSSAFGGPEPTWIQFELDKVYPLHEMWVWNSNTGLESSIGYGFQDVTIEYSLDGIEYATLGTTHEFARAPGVDGYAHNTVIDFGGVQAKYVKLTANTNWAPFPFPQFGLSEIRLLHIPMRARKPQPDQGTTDVPVDVTVSWRAGRQTAEHNVYVSTDEQAVIDGTAPVITVAEASLTPSLDLDSTYYWRVDEINDVETPTTWEGDIWNFSTQEFLVVDDFESYNDIADGEEGSNLVYLTWIDGFDNPSANGSTMGYTVPFEPTMETGTVHSGNQSAPMMYDNTTAAISEVTRTLTAQDWTANGIQTLCLWFFGNPANTPGQLYVKINGVKVNYDGDSANLSRPRWHRWNIDLASVGTNLQSVTSLAIGIDGSGATGLLLLDSIALYRVAPELPVQVYLEAEAAMPLGASWRSYVDPASSGGQHIGSEDGDGNDNDAAPGPEWTASYNFEVPVEGIYTVVLRAQVVGDDSFWVRIPGATAQSHEDPAQAGTGWVKNDIDGSEGEWDWHGVESQDHSDASVSWTLPAGPLTIEIAKREDGVLLDAILIRADID